MAESRSKYDYTVFIDAPVHSVFEYCCDPHRIYAGDPEYEVVAATVTKETVGTRAQLKAGSGKIFAEDVEIEYVEVVEDQQIVFQGHPRLTIAGLGNGVPFATTSFSWTFEPKDTGTLLHLSIVEQDPPRWERILGRIGEKSFSRQVRNRLDRIKAHIEESTSSVR